MALESDWKVICCHWSRSLRHVHTQGTYEKIPSCHMWLISLGEGWLSKVVTLSLHTGCLRCLWPVGHCLPGWPITGLTESAPFSWWSLRAKGPGRDPCPLVSKPFQVWMGFKTFPGFSDLSKPFKPGHRSFCWEWVGYIREEQTLLDCQLGENSWPERRWQVK